MRTIPPGLNVSRFRVTKDGCHEWLGARGRKGHGVVGNHRGTYLAHRVAYAYAHGTVPAGMQLDHLCRNPACINPDHLEPVTNATNTRRGDRAKINPAIVSSMRTMRREGATYREIGLRFGVSETCAHDACNGRRWGDVVSKNVPQVVPEPRKRAERRGS